MRFPIADVDFDALMTCNSRLNPAGRDWLLCGDEYGRMKLKLSKNKGFLDKPRSM
jgi:hypothetical protein